MKLGGGLAYVTGPMGAGKTFKAVREIVRFTTAKRYVVTNVELLDDWAERVAAHVSRFTASRARRAQLADLYRRAYVYEPDLQAAVRYMTENGLPGRGEARGLFVWDEGHNDLNNRRWKDEGRDTILEFATQLRKLGYLGLLLTQHADNTDAALRRFCNYHVRLQNQREQTRTLGVRITPWPLFLAYWYPAHLGEKGQQVKAIKTERYFLSWHRHLYDTHGLFHGLAAARRTTLPELVARPLPGAAGKGAQLATSEPPRIIVP